MIWLAVAGLMLGAAGCTTPQQATERPWVEVRSEHFTIMSSLHEVDTIALARELEFFRAAVLALTSVKSVNSAIPIQIYAFDTAESFRDFNYRRSAGYIISDLRGYYVALVDSSGFGAVDILKHEYAHFLLRNKTSLVYPRWFDEGFAVFLSTIEIRDGYATVGSVPEHRMQQLAESNWIPMRKVLANDGARFWSRREVGMFYSQSWALVHYLMRDEVARLKFSNVIGTFLGQIESGASEEEASRSAFGVSPRKLTKLLQEYMRGGQFEFFGIEESALDWSPEVKVGSVSEPAVAERLGQLALLRGRLEVAERLFARALEIDPGLARAHSGMGDVIKARHRWEDARPYFERAVELDPEDPLNQLDLGEYWHARAKTAGEPTARHEMLVTARRHYKVSHELDDARPETYSVYGATYLLDGEDATKGVETLEYAEHLLASNLQIRIWLAEAYVRVDRDDDARARLETVIAWGHEGPITEKARALLEELDARAPDSDEVSTN